MNYATFRAKFYSFLFEPKKTEKLIPELNKTNNFYTRLQYIDRMRMRFVDFANRLTSKMMLVIVFGSGLIVFLLEVRSLFA